MSERMPMSERSERISGNSAAANAAAERSEVCP
jgi:hypothetical protein